MGHFKDLFGKEIDEYRARFGGRIFDWVNPMSFFVNVRWGILAFFSGVAALIYQTLWVKQLSLVVGVDVYAVTTGVAAFLSVLPWAASGSAASATGWPGRRCFLPDWRAALPCRGPQPPSRFPIARRFLSGCTVCCRGRPRTVEELDQPGCLQGSRQPLLPRVSWGQSLMVFCMRKGGGAVTKI